ncbi:lipocalin family protein [Spirosoma sp. KCTC 42546]|uniref:lipocalin family protein n=1 Tax=Spirosoma sp. KCTC 42546 TaxID=2520506 RepID=UPI00115917D8|nr:lipocalin family protein [Spirosoma sp. KCTC 42546]QDK78520.1 lipocalin family protein [Spirosoma sp. KCTC 42546]
MIRSFLFVTLITLIGTAFRPTLSPKFASIAGTWKRTGMSLVEATGKTTDMMALMNSSMPCSKDITYTFLGDGQMKTIVPDACGAMKKTIEDMSVNGKWSMSGQKVTITTTMKDIPPATYDVSFTGDTMTWVFNFSDNPKAPNPTKAKRMALIYQRV